MDGLNEVASKSRLFIRQLGELLDIGFSGRVACHAPQKLNLNEGSCRTPPKFLKRHNFHNLLHGTPKENHKESYMVRKLRYSSIIYLNLAGFYECFLTH